MFRITRATIGAGSQTKCQMSCFAALDLDGRQLVDGAVGRETLASPARAELARNITTPPTSICFMISFFMMQDPSKKQEQGNPSPLTLASPLATVSSFHDGFVYDYALFS